MGVKDAKRGALEGEVVAMSAALKGNILIIQKISEETTLENFRYGDTNILQ